MKSKEKQASYTTTNTYSTLNNLGPKTKNIWIVFHGIGYLSRYFINFFDTLSADENYIIAPQAPSKYYLKGQYRHVGACWLTKENTVIEIDNVLNSIDAIYKEEVKSNNQNIIVLGFSQGVSIASRWVAKRKIKCAQLIFYAGGLPEELSAKDFAFLQTNKTEVKIIIGDKDPFLTPTRMVAENEKIENLFKGQAHTINFKGMHEVKKEIIEQLIDD